MIDFRYFILSVPVLTMCIAFAVIHRGVKIKEKNDKLSRDLALRKEMLKRRSTYTREVVSFAKQIKEDIDNPEVIRTLSERCGKDRGITLTGDYTFDSMLNYKRIMCEKRNITLTLDVQKLEQNPLDERETISLIGNLMDNAIEAASKCSEDSGRWIEFICRCAKGQMIIKVKNSKIRDERPIENNMQTTKEDAVNHGIGSKIIKRIIKNKDGYIKMNDKGVEFEVYTAFPLTEVKKNVENRNM